GPKDIEKASVIIARRDNREKISVSMSGLAGHLLQLLDDVQKSLFERARTYREEHTLRASTWEEFTKLMETRPGFVMAPWCGSAECEARIKAETQATIRNMPLDGQSPGGTCVRCDKPAAHEAWFAKAY